MIGDRIKTVRKELKLNQSEFGKNIGISAPLVVAIEKEQRNLTDRVKGDIIRVYNVNPTYLDTGDGPIFKEGYKQKEEIKRMLPKLESLTVEQLNALDTLIDTFIKGV